jgi:hypothetical protein
MQKVPVVEGREVGSGGRPGAVDGSERKLEVRMMLVLQLCYILLYFHNYYIEDP